MARRDVLISALLLVVAPFVIERVQFYLHDAFATTLGLGSGSEPSPMLLLSFFLGLALFALVGILLAYVLRAHRVIWWALAFGLLYALLRVAFYNVHASAEHPATLPLALLWGILVVAPVLGTVIGAVGFRWFQSSRQLPPDAA